MANFRGSQGAPDRKNAQPLIFEDIVPFSGWTEDSSSHYLLVDLPEFKREEVKLQVDEHGHVDVMGERRVSENKYKRFKQTFTVPENSNIEKISGKFEGELLYVTVPKKVQEEQENTQNNTSNGGVGEKNEEERPKEDENLENNKDKNGNSNGDHVNLQDANKRMHEEEEERQENFHEANKRMHEEEEERQETFHEANAERWGYDESYEHANMLGSVINQFSKNKGIIITAVLAFSLGVYVTQKIQSNGQ